MDSAPRDDDAAIGVKAAADDAPRAVLAAAMHAAASGDAAATLAVVVDAEGSTYVGCGAAVLFSGAGQEGWISGGCLEPEIARAAAACAAGGRLGWRELDAREDGDVLLGSGAGCRGRLLLVLLPLAAMPGIDAILRAWLEGTDSGDREHAPLRLRADAGGGVTLERLGGPAGTWRLPPADDATGPDDAARAFVVDWAPSPRLLLFGAGPETPALLPLLRGLGWHTTLVERRPRWSPLAALADAHAATTPAAAFAAPPRADAALVMNHHFELDREALLALAPSAIAWLGLLGPGRRREDLLRLLPAAAVAALRPRLQSPVGLDLGGRGAAAIALSIAAALQAWRHGRAAPR